MEKEYLTLEGNIIYSRQGKNGSMDLKIWIISQVYKIHLEKSSPFEIGDNVRLSFSKTEPAFPYKHVRTKKVNIMDLIKREILNPVRIEKLVTGHVTFIHDNE